MDNDKIEAKLIENWDVYLNLIKRIENQKISENLSVLLREQAERILVCPASTKTTHIGAFPGGLVIHSLSVLRIMKEMNKVNGTNCSVDDMIVTALFHDIGKIGSSTEDYYLAQKSDWHKDRGILFEINPKLGNVPIVARSIWWLNNYNVNLNENVLEALFSLYSSAVNNRISELYNVSNLSLLLQNSVRSSCVINKGKNSVLEI